MQTAQHAIMVGLNHGAWEWQLIDPNGLTAASGLADTQQVAMETAWKAAKLDTAFGVRGYPEVLVSYGWADREADA
jgi:hypothetical protein